MKHDLDQKEYFIHNVELGCIQNGIYLCKQMAYGISIYIWHIHLHILHALIPYQVGVCGVSILRIDLLGSAADR